MMDYETFIKTNFTDQVAMDNPDIQIIKNPAADHPLEFSFLINDPPLFDKPSTTPITTEAPPINKPKASASPLLDADYVTAQKEQALKDYTNNVRKLTLSLEKQKTLYRERSQQLKNQLDHQVASLNQQANRTRIELRQQIIDQRSGHARQLEAYEKEFLSEKSELIRRHTEEIASLNKQLHQDYILKEAESKRQLKSFEAEYDQQLQSLQDKIRGIQQHYESEHQKVRQQYEPIIQSEQSHFQRMLGEIKEKRDKLLSDFEAQRKQLKDHYEPLIQSDKERYRSLLSTLISEKEQLIAELNKVK